MKKQLSPLNRISPLSFSVYILISLLLFSCQSEVPSPEDGDQSGNVNANAQEITHSNRLEIPKLKVEEDNMFIVKKAKLRDNGNDMFVNFSMEFDKKKKSSRWIAFRWDIDNTYDSNCGRAGNFTGDPDVQAQYRVEGYFKGFQRGHMLASEDRQCSADANRQTFYMTNMQPQYGRFNGYDNDGSYVWLNAEQLVRKLYSGWTKAHNASDTIYVVKGGTIDHDNMILGYTSCGSTSNIIVPRYFYMALLYKAGKSQTHGYKAIAMWFEHKENDTTSGKAIAQKYAISIDELERKTGIDFFCNLPDYIEDDVEKRYNLKAWGWE